MELTELQRTLALVIVVASLTAIITFVTIYLTWLRSILKKLIEVQILLKKVSTLFNHVTGVPALPDVSPAIPREKVEMSVEGKFLAITQVNGRDEVQFKDNLSEDEKRRILQYLKVEGFIDK